MGAPGAEKGGTTIMESQKVRQHLVSLTASRFAFISKISEVVEVIEFIKSLSIPSQSSKRV